VTVGIGMSPIAVVERTAITAFKPWNCSRSRASARATPALSLDHQMIGGGAMSSGANRILDISSAWSVKGSGDRRGGASECMHAARSVAVRLSSVLVGSGTGPCCWYREGTTTSVVDIIPSTEANDPLFAPHVQS